MTFIFFQLDTRNLTLDCRHHTQRDRQTEWTEFYAGPPTSPQALVSTFSGTREKSARECGPFELS